MKNKLNLKAYIFLLIALTFYFPNVMATDFKATAKLDSVTMLAGSKTSLKVDFSGPLDKQARIDIMADSLNPDMEIVPDNDQTITDIGNGRRRLLQSFSVQVFDSGLYKLPPILCISGADTTLTNALVIKVDPFPLDSANLVIENGEVKDFAPNDFSDLYVPESKFWDFMPDWAISYGWWILLALIVISLSIFVYMKWLRHGRIPLIPVKKPTPPYELAVSRLNKLQQEQLWQKGAEKEYYTQLTDILRAYLCGRFGINALEMTSPQILDAISNDNGVHEYSALINAVLTQADFVKFAKARPSADENSRSFENVRQFVELTKPVVQPEDDDNKEKNSEGQNKSQDTSNQATVDHTHFLTIPSESNSIASDRNGDKTPNV